MPQTRLSNASATQAAVPQATTTQEAAQVRRGFLRDVVSVVGSMAGLTLTGCASTRTARGEPSTAGGDDQAEAEVTPGEDLMQEHGVIARIGLIYDESVRRIEAGASTDANVFAVVGDAARIVRRFVEDYHEKLEEQFVFPRLQKAQREVELVAILLRQHERGRELTDEILRTASAAAGPELAQRLRSFVRMYRPHAAREDTVLFPAFREVVGRKAYRELGEQFEAREHTLLGKSGFRDTVAQVAKIESALGIADLASFTPV